MGPIRRACSGVRPPCPLTGTNWGRVPEGLDDGIAIRGRTLGRKERLSKAQHFDVAEPPPQQMGTQPLSKMSIEPRAQAEVDSVGGCVQKPAASHRSVRRPFQEVSHSGAACSDGGWGVIR